MSELTQDQLQYIFCAVCLDCQDLLEAKGQEVQLAITIVAGTAACEEHRRRVSFNYGQVVSNARKFYQEGPRSMRNGYRENHPR
jgi:anthranilate/para-aminobenzoate synthase component II